MFGILLIVSVHTRRLADQAFLCSLRCFSLSSLLSRQADGDSCASATLILCLQWLFTADAHREFYCQAMLFQPIFQSCRKQTWTLWCFSKAACSLASTCFLYTASKHLRRKIWLPTSPHNPETYFDPLSQKLWCAKRKDYMVMRGKPSNLGPICCYCLLA